MALTDEVLEHLYSLMEPPQNDEEAADMRKLVEDLGGYIAKLQDAREQFGKMVRDYNPLAWAIEGMNKLTPEQNKMLDYAFEKANGPTC